MHVGCLLTLKLPEDAAPDFVTRIVDAFRAPTELRKPFQHVLKPAYPSRTIPSWEQDPDYDANWHVRHIALPPPGDMDQLGTLVGELHSGVLERHRPLWECTVIEGIEGGRFAIYGRVHHACIDGMGGMEVLQDMFSKDPAPGPIRPPWAADPAAAEEHPPGFFSRTEKLFKLSFRQATSLPEVGLAMLRLGTRSLSSKKRRSLMPYSAPRSLLNRSVSGDRKIAMQNLELEPLKAAARLAGVTLNDLVLAICAGALREYLIGKGKLPKDPLLAFVPVALKGEKVGDAHNQICNLQCDLATEAQDPLERLARVRFSMRTGKQQVRDMSSAAMQNYSILLGAPFLLSEVFEVAPMLPPPFNLVISNVPGPAETLYLNGAELEGFYPVSVLPDSQALNITFLSYGDTMRFGLVACWKVLPDVDRLAELIQTEWLVLQDAVATEYTEPE